MIKPYLQQYMNDSADDKSYNVSRAQLMKIVGLIIPLDQIIKSVLIISYDVVDNALISLLEETNDGCHFLFTVTSLWHEQHSMTCPYKTVFYS
jgi:hypothetical protein